MQSLYCFRPIEKATACNGKRYGKTILSNSNSGNNCKEGELETNFIGPFFRPKCRSHYQSALMGSARKSFWKPQQSKITLNMELQSHPCPTTRWKSTKVGRHRTVGQTCLPRPCTCTETFSCVFVLFTVLKGIKNNQLITWNNTKRRKTFPCVRGPRSLGDYMLASRSNC